MGAGATTFNDQAFELKLSRDERARYKQMYAEMEKAGNPASRIQKQLTAKLEAERAAKPPVNRSKAVAVAKKTRNQIQRRSMDNSALSPKAGGNSFFPSSDIVTSHAPDIQMQGLLHSASGPTIPSVNDMGNTAPTIVPVQTNSVPHAEMQSSVAVGQPTAGLNNSVKHHFGRVHGHGHPPSAGGGGEIKLSGPFNCDLCKATFSNAHQLDRHIKYSDRHARSIRDHCRAGQLSLLAHRCVEAFRKAAIEKANAQQNWSRAKIRWHWAYNKVKMQNAIDKTSEMLMEIYHAKSSKKGTKGNFLFEGSKFFWRSQENIELHIYLHDEDTVKQGSPDGSWVIEVIGFEHEKNRELERLYLSYGVLTRVLRSEIAAAIEKVKRHVAGDKKVIHNVLVEFLLNNLQTAPFPGKAAHKQLILVTSNKAEVVRDLKRGSAGGSSSSAGATLKVQTAANDGVLIDPSLVKSILKPIVIMRRRKSTQAETQQVRSDIVALTSEMSELTERARVIADLLSNSIQTFQGMAKAKEIDVETRPKTRWYNAIRKVVRQIEVQRTAEMLEAKGILNPTSQQGQAEPVKAEAGKALREGNTQGGKATPLAATVRPTVAVEV